MTRSVVELDREHYEELVNSLKQHRALCDRYAGLCKESVDLLAESEKYTSEYLAVIAYLKGYQKHLEEEHWLQVVHG